MLGFRLSADSSVHPTLCALNLFDTELYINLAQAVSVRFEFNDYLYWNNTVRSFCCILNKYVAHVLFPGWKDKNLLSTQFPASHTSLCVIGQNCRTCMKTLTSTNQLRVGKVCLSLLSVLHPILSACLPQPNRSQRFDLLEKKSRERSIMQL